MAQRNKPIVGLDIDPVGIHAVTVTGGEHATIEHAATVILEPGVVRDGEVQDVEALGEALKALFAGHKQLDSRVRVGVANQKVVVRTIELPPIDDAKELDAAIRFQAQDAIPMPLDQAVLDYQVLDVIETENGPRQQVIIAAARQDMIERVVAAVRAAGLRLDGIDLSAFAMIRALAPETSAEEVALYAQVGGTTNVAVARGPVCLFTRASGTGVEGLAIELAERRQLTLEHARAWLLHVGLEQPVELIDGEPEIVAEARRVLEDGVRRIGGEIRQSVDFHHMQTDGAYVARAVVTGPAVRIPGFVSALGVELGLEAAAGIVPGLDASAGAGELAIAAGLATSGQPGVNLLPAEDRRAAGAGGRSGGAVYALLGAMALALILMTSWVLAENNVTKKEDELALVTVQAKEAEQTAKALAAYTDFAALREKRIDTIRSLAETRFDWAHALGEIARTVPANVWLTSLNGSVTSGGDGSSGLRAALNVPAVDVLGCTTSQANVATMMSAMRQIDGVQRVSLESSEKADIEADDGGGGGAGGGGNSSDCRNGSDEFPQFKMTVFFKAPAGAAAPGAPAASGGAPTAPQTASGAASNASAAGQAAGGSTPAPANSGAAIPADNGGAQ